MKSQGYDVRTNNRFNVWFISFCSEMKDHFMLLAVHFIFCVKYRKRVSLTILVFVFMVRTNTLGLSFFEVSLVCPCKFSPWAIGQCPQCRFPMRGLRVKFFHRVQRQTKNGSNLL
jgi:hypothetical protein